MLMRSYMQKLIDNECMYKLSQVKKLDILDITGFTNPPDNGYGIPNFPPATEDEKEAINKLGWYAFIPCFEIGAIKLNKFRYIVFCVEEINPERQLVRVRVADYFKADDLWQIGVMTVVKAKLLDVKDPETGTNHYVNAFHTEDAGFEDMYTLYDREDLGWSENDWQFWMDTVVKNAILVKEEMQKLRGTNQCDQLARIFTLLICRCNSMLELNKPSRPVKPKTVPGAARKVTYEKGAAPERKTRMVGSLRVQSENIPRKPCLETVITYKVAKWTVRGHTRHYKSGKTVYINPTVRKRKALEGTDEMTATTIRFKKKKTEDKENAD